MDPIPNKETHDEVHGQKVNDLSDVYIDYGVSFLDPFSVSKYTSMYMCVCSLVCV